MTTAPSGTVGVGGSGVEVAVEVGTAVAVDVDVLVGNGLGVTEFVGIAPVVAVDDAVADSVPVAVALAGLDG